MLQRRALVLGSGNVADAMAEDLERGGSITVARADAPGATLDGHDVVLSAAPREQAAEWLRRLIEAGRPVVDVAAPVADALDCDALARDHQVSVCVGCGSLRGLLSLSPAARADDRAAALLATALARRLLSGDFRPHWGVWTPERLLARVGIAHGLREDLRERGIV